MTELKKTFGGKHVGFVRSKQA